MGGPAVPQLAAAVSNAGALGMLALSWSDDAGGAVRELRDLTPHPFGGNFGLHLDQHERLDSCTRSRPAHRVALLGRSGSVRRARPRRGCAARAHRRLRRGGQARRRRRRRRHRRAGLRSGRPRVGTDRIACARARGCRRGRPDAGDRGRRHRRRSRSRRRLRARRTGCVGRHALPPRRRSTGARALPAAPDRRRRDRRVVVRRPLRRRLAERAAPRVAERDDRRVGSSRPAAERLAARRRRPGRDLVERLADPALREPDAGRRAWRATSTRCRSGPGRASRLRTRSSPPRQSSPSSSRGCSLASWNAP